jgi:hypothetical protein
VFTEFLERSQLEDYAEATQALNMLHRELMDLNPSSARRLGGKIGGNADRALAPSSATTARDGQPPASSNQPSRSSNGFAPASNDGTFRLTQGHKQIPILLRELEALVPAKTDVVKRGKA